MAANGRSKSLEIRQRLSHPILDADGHWLEFEPAVLPLTVSPSRKT
jgi:hypothetical protein